MKHNYWKPLMLMVMALLMAQVMQAVTVNLAITYNGRGVANNDITIKVGDMTLGRGKTDGNGNVSINVSQLPTPAIDVYGSVVTNNGSKTWDVKGWVTLNESNFGQLKFEEVFSEMGIPEGMFAEAWGLVFSTGGGSASGNSGSTNNNGGGNNGGGNVNRSNVEERPVTPREPALPAGYKCAPINNVDFSKNKSMVAGENFDSGKLSAIKGFFAKNCYDAAQAKEMVALLGFDSDRLDAAKKGYQNCANQGMYLAEVSPALEMSMNRDELRAFINGNDDDEDGDDFSKQPYQRPEPKPKPAPEPKAAPAPKPAPAPVPMEKDDVSFRTENGEPFILYLEGKQVNTEYSSDVMTKLPTPHSMAPRVKFVFEDKSIPVLEKKALLTGTSDYYSFIVRKNEKGEWIVRLKL